MKKSIIFKLFIFLMIVSCQLNETISKDVKTDRVQTEINFSFENTDDVSNRSISVWTFPDVANYRLIVTNSSNEQTTYESGVSNFILDLEIGTYDLAAYAFSDTGELLYTALNNSVDINLGNVSLDILLYPEIGTGIGTISTTITWPHMYEGCTVDVQIGRPGEVYSSINLTTEGLTGSGSISLESGSYHLIATITLDNKKTLSKVSSAWIIGGEIVDLNLTFLAEDLEVAKLFTQDDYNLALLSNGTVMRWGKSREPAIVSGLTNVVDISNAYYDTFALQSDGTLVTWNGYSTYSKINEISNVVKIASGAYHTLALLSDGTVYSWGSNNSYGQLGNGTTDIHESPMIVPELNDIKDIFAGAYCSFTVSTDGTVKGFGSHYDGKLGVGTVNDSKVLIPTEVVGILNPAKISTSYSHTLALFEDGTIKAWGDNDEGQLGIENLYSSKVPVSVDSISNVVDISAGKLHSVAVLSDGTVKTWGDNYSCQLGDGTRTDSIIPITVPNINSAKAVSAGYHHTNVILSNGDIISWGRSYNEQIPGVEEYQFSPTVNPDISNIKFLSSSSNHTLAVKDDGTVWAWGSNSSGQLGDGTLIEKLVPTQIEGLFNIVSVAAGNSFSLALNESGQIYAWGYNAYGQLGDGTSISSSVPILLDNISNVVSISCGSLHSLALLENGTVMTWGKNNYGQLGDGTLIDKSMPAIVPGLNNVTKITAGSGFSIVLIENGTIMSWGRNSYGQLGHSEQVDVLIPELITGLNGIVDIESGPLHTLVLTQDSEVYTWGYNGFGQAGLGNDAAYYITSPEKITRISDVISISAAGDSSGAVLSDGSLYVWGYADQVKEDQFSGSGWISRYPYKFYNLTDIKEVFIGSNCGFAINDSSELIAWGDYFYLGFGIDAFQPSEIGINIYNY